jgi:hypothetical protein
VEAVTPVDRYRVSAAQRGEAFDGFHWGAWKDDHHVGREARLWALWPSLESVTFSSKNPFLRAPPGHPLADRDRTNVTGPTTGWKAALNAPDLFYGERITFNWRNDQRSHAIFCGPVTTPRHLAVNSHEP